MDKKDDNKTDAQVTGDNDSVSNDGGFESISPEDLDPIPQKRPQHEQQSSEETDPGTTFRGNAKDDKGWIQGLEGIAKALSLAFKDVLDLKHIRQYLPEGMQQKLPENPRLITVPVFILLLGLLFIVLLAIFAPTASKKATDKTIPLVGVVKVEKQAIRIPVYSQGLVEPETEIQIVSLVSGAILELSPNLVDGGRVEEGELLVRISDRNYLQDKARAEANLARAKSAQIAKQSELRVQGTLRTSSGTAQLIEVNAAVAAAEADLQRVKDLIENTRVVAPFSGIIRRTKLQQGQVLSVGMPIASLFSTEAAVVHIPLSDRQLGLVDLLALGDQEALPEALIKGEFGNREYFWQGKMVRLAGGRNEINRLQYATVEVEQPYGSDPGQPQRPPLTPGFFVDVEVQGKVFEDIVRLPRKSLKSNQRIWGVRDNKLMVFEDTEVVYRAQDYIYVSSGIEDGDLVVVSDLEVFVSGIEVKTKELEVESREKADVAKQSINSTIDDAEPTQQESKSGEQREIQTKGDSGEKQDTDTDTASQADEAGVKEEGSPVP